jgi:dolichol-phosphate mannosyltransferase
VSRVTRLLTWALLRASRRTTDPLSGCFVVRRAVVDGTPLRPVGFKILLEILVRGRYDRVADVPYVFAGRHAGRTKATLRQGFDLVRHLVRLTAASPDDARFWKFMLVGASGVLANVAVFWLLVHPMRTPVVHAGVVAAALSTFTNFLLNNTFTWADRRAVSWSVFLRRLGKYYIATGAGNLVYLALLWGLTHLGMVPMLANIIAIGVGGTLNYVAHNAWTWRHQGTG